MVGYGDNPLNFNISISSKGPPTRFKIILGFSLILSCYFIWLLEFPPKPLPLHKILFSGITYLREVRDLPRPLVIHRVLIDLTSPSLSFLVTPGTPNQTSDLRARTTSQFLREFKTQIAINASLFYPFYSNTPWDYYPRIGSPVKILGLTASQGKIYASAKKGFSIFYLTADNRAQFEKPPAGKIYHAISGKPRLLEAGQLSPLLLKDNSIYHDVPYPRTAIALNQRTHTLILVVIDGKQKHYSEGVTLIELAKILQEFQVDEALNLDGGGSSTLVMQGHLGKPVVLNSPIHTRLRGRERPVGNHLGIYVHQ